MLFFLIKIDAITIIVITATIAITPVQPSITTILLPSDIIIPANKTPSVVANILVLKPRFKKLAARVPVQAPVPGKGIPTKINKAQKIPLSPAEALSFCPAPGGQPAAPARQGQLHPVVLPLQPGAGHRGHRRGHGL